MQAPCGFGCRSGCAFKGQPEAPFIEYSMKYDLRNKVVAITGAASGIGRALAQNLDKRGCRLAIADRDSSGLAQTASLLSNVALTQSLDVADRAQVEAFARRVVEHHGGANVIINNAGVSLVQNVADATYDDMEWLMNINFWGVVHGTKAFLPTFLLQGDGVIVNVSSVLGLTAMPSQSAYAAAKHAVKGFTDALRAELQGKGVHVVGVYPGGVRTNIVHTARIYEEGGVVAKRDSHIQNFERMAKLSPDKAAAIIVHGIESRKSRVLVGADAAFVDLLQRLMPTGAVALMAKLIPEPSS